VAKHPIGVHVGPGLTGDNELEDGGPLARAAEMDADGVQIFLTDPQSYKAPKPRPDAADLLDGDVMVIVHAPYMLNVASTNNRIRVPGRKLLAQHAQAAAAVGARGLVVHGGHVVAEDDPAVGVDNWRKTFAYQAKAGGFPLPLFIENTAGGGNAMARQTDRIARVFEAVQQAEGAEDVGFCLDTCHAHAGGNDLGTVVDEVRAITGRIDLVHANDSRDEFDSGADRHTNFGSGHIAGEALAGVIRAAGAPVVCETPGGLEGQSADIAWLRSHV